MPLYEGENERIRTNMRSQMERLRRAGMPAAEAEATARRVARRVHNNLSEGRKGDAADPKSRG